MGFRPKPARVTSTPGTRVSTPGRSRASFPLSPSASALFSILESAGDVMYTHDGAGNFTWVNAAAERFSGYGRGELLDMNILDLLVSEQASAVQERWAQRSAGELPAPFTAEVIVKDGSRRTLEVVRSRQQQLCSWRPQGRTVGQLPQRRRSARSRDRAALFGRTLSTVIPAQPCRRVSQQVGRWAARLQRFVRTHLRLRIARANDQARRLQSVL